MKVVKVICLIFFLLMTISRAYSAPCPPEAANGEICKEYSADFCTVGMTIELCEAKVAKRGWSFGSALAYFNGDKSSLFSGVLSLLVALLGFLIAKARKRVLDLTTRLGDPVAVNTKDLEYKTKGVNLLIIGEGGSGKTSIVRALSGSYHARPSRASSTPTTYSIVHEVDVKKDDDTKETIRNIERIYVNDYKGQESPQMFAGDLNDREILIPSTVLLIVVDLFYPRDKSESPLQPQETYDKKRVKQHLTAYNENLIELLKDHPNKLQRIILFINKIDNIRPIDINEEDNVIKAYKSLISALHKQGSEFDFSVLVGSASTGLSICGFDPQDLNKSTLYELLKLHMVNIKIEKPDKFLFLHPLLKPFQKGKTLENE